MGQADSVFVRNFILILAGMVALAIIVFVLAQNVATPDKIARKDSDANIARVSEVKTVSVATKLVARKSPAQLGAACLGCHKTGVAGAPKMGDKAAWGERAKKGVDEMVKIVVKGKGAMPPKGGTTLSDAEIKEVIVYMLGEAGIKK